MNPRKLTSWLHAFIHGFHLLKEYFSSYLHLQNKLSLCYLHTWTRPPWHLNLCSVKKQCYNREVKIWRTSDWVVTDFKDLQTSMWHHLKGNKQAVQPSRTVSKEASSQQRIYQTQNPSLSVFSFLLMLADVSRCVCRLTVTLTTEEARLNGGIH